MDHRHIGLPAEPIPFATPASFLTGIKQRLAQAPTIVPTAAKEPQNNSGAALAL